MGTTWTGERSMETLPLDRVYILLVADCWFNEPEKKEGEEEGEGEGEESEGEEVGKLLKRGITSEEARKAYLKLRSEALSKGFDAKAFVDKQAQVWKGSSKEV